jgi:voltage-gated potassium channel
MAETQFIRSKIYTALLLLLVLISIGSLGYMTIENYEFIDALYMTVITITTVGFKEVNPLDFQGKIFTIILIFTSVGLYGYILSVITDYISNSNLMEELKTKKVQKKINKLKNHTIVCGYGRNGKQALAKLGYYNRQCVIIENDPDLYREIEMENNVLCVKGDATDDEILIKAGIVRAASLIATLPSDANNLYIVLSARQLNEDCKIVSRASNDSSYNKLKIAGADNVIMPDKLGGSHMASLVVTPDIMEFIDRLSIEGKSSTNLEEILIENLPKEYQSKSLIDLDLREKTGCNVVAFITPEKEYIINPEVNTMLVPHSKIIVLGKPEEIKKLNLLF